MLATTERAYRALAELDLPRGYEFDRSDSARSRQEGESRHKHCLERYYRIGRRYRFCDLTPAPYAISK
jgi:hypothetical protein